MEEIEINSKISATNALKMRNKLAKTKEERRKLIEQAAKYVPALAESIMEKDRRKGLV